MGRSNLLILAIGGAGVLLLALAMGYLRRQVESRPGPGEAGLAGAVQERFAGRLAGPPRILLVGQELRVRGTALEPGDRSLPRQVGELLLGRLAGHPGARVVVVTLREADGTPLPVFRAEAGASPAASR